MSSLRIDPVEFRGLACLRLAAGGATALVSLRGAQVLSWIPPDGRERLFLAEAAGRVPGAALRGGIPVIFPQFGDRGPLRKHGFARLLDWSFAGSDGASAQLELRASAATAEWPHAFACRLSVALSATGLEVSLDIANTGDTAFGCTAALHTYLRVGDATGATIEGLHGCDFEDSAAGGTLHRQHEALVGFEGETDRIYGDVVAPLVLVDADRRVAIEHDGFADAVIWNPGERLAAGIADLAPGEWRTFVCVEAAQVLQPLRLAPGEHWRGSQRLG